MGLDQGREPKIRGGLEPKKHTAVRTMYNAMLKKTTKMTLCAERDCKAPVAKQEENVDLVIEHVRISG
jgi:hypothetical protein